MEQHVSFLLSSVAEPLIHAAPVPTALREGVPHCLYCVPYLEKASGQGRELKQPQPREERGALSEDGEYSCSIWIFSRFHFSFWFLPQDGSWADSACETKLGYVCKRKPLAEESGEAEVTHPGCQKVSVKQKQWKVGASHFHPHDSEYHRSQLFWLFLVEP